VVHRDDGYACPNTPYRRKSTYDFRARSPRDLQPNLGKVEEKFSLKTKDYAKARRLARKVSVDFDRHCERLLEEICSRQAEKCRLPPMAQAPYMNRNV